MIFWQLDCRMFPKASALRIKYIYMVVSRQEQESRCWFWDPLTIFHIWVQMHFWPTLVVGLPTQPTRHTNSIMHLLWVTRSIKCKIVNFSTLSFFKFPSEHFPFSLLYQVIGLHESSQSLGFGWAFHLGQWLVFRDDGRITAADYAKEAAQATAEGHAVE